MSWEEVELRCRWVMSVFSFQYFIDKKQTQNMLITIEDVDGYEEEDDDEVKEDDKENEESLLRMLTAHIKSPCGR